MESVVQEINNLANELSKNGDNPEIEARIRELREYHKKLDEQYQSLAGMSVKEASTLSGTQKADESTKSIVRIIFQLVASIAALWALVEMSFQATGRYDVTSYLDAFLSGVVLSDSAFMIVVERNSYLYAVAFGISILFAGILVILPQELIKRVDGISLLAISGWFGYVFLGMQISYFTIYDLSWTLRDSNVVYAAVLVFAGLMVMLSGVKSSLSVKLLSIVEGILYMGSGIYMYLQITSVGNYMSAHIVYSLAYVIGGLLVRSLRSFLD